MDEILKKKVLQSLETIFQELFLDDHLKINENTSPVDIEEWDSLAHINLLATVENSFGVTFTADDMGRIKDVSTLLVVLAERGVK